MILLKMLWKGLPRKRARKSRKHLSLKRKKKENKKKKEKKRDRKSEKKDKKRRKNNEPSTEEKSDKESEDVDMSIPLTEIVKQKSKEHQESRSGEERVEKKGLKRRKWKRVVKWFRSLSHCWVKWMSWQEVRRHRQ